jgi:hypothetical protein
MKLIMQAIEYAKTRTKNKKVWQEPIK